MAKFTIPEDVTALDNDALSAAVEEAFAAFGAFAEIADADLTDEQITDMGALQGFHAAGIAELEAREVAAAQKAEKLAGLRQSMAKKPAPAEGSPAEEEQETPAEEEIEDKDKKTKASAEAKSFAARAAAAAPAPKAARPQGSKLSVSADVPGIAAGTTFNNFAEAAEVITSRLKSLPTNAPNARIRQGALTIQLPENEFSQSNEKYYKRDEELLMDAANESRLSGGSLVAAGGWGAPSERSLDFCELENLDSLISLPEVTITRGGVQYTKGPTFADVLGSSTGFWDMSEATADAGTELKTSYRPTVPTFTEKRLDAVGFMMEAGLLLRQGWPELVQRHANLLATAHQYKMAKKTISLIQGYTGAATAISNGFGNALDILHILEMLAIGERQRLALSVNQTLEALVPIWVKAIIRADLAQRTAVDTISVTDAQINAHFTARGIKVQWLNAYQDLTITGTGAAAHATAYPSTVEVIFYVAGTFVRGVAPVIQLDTIYDSTNLKKNDYVHVFMEQGVLVTNPCGDGHRVSFPLYANGRRAGVTDAAGTAGQNDNLFLAPVANA